MNEAKSILSVLLLSGLMFSISNTALAWVWEGGTRKVESLRFASEGVYVRFNPPLANCLGGDQYRMHARFLNAQANTKTMTAALLAAYTTGNTLNGVWVTGDGTPCSTTSILNLDMIELDYK